MAIKSQLDSSASSLPRRAISRATASFCCSSLEHDFSSLSESLSVASSLSESSSESSSSSSSSAECCPFRMASLGTLALVASKKSSSLAIALPVSFFLGGGMSSSSTGGDSVVGGAATAGGDSVRSRAGTAVAVAMGCGAMSVSVSVSVLVRCDGWGSAEALIGAGRAPTGLCSAFWAGRAADACAACAVGVVVGVATVKTGHDWPRLQLCI
mmetsp:Transcript_3384/g.10517  ORF Transcript_3384/g.10517 Transcript_3384/m.10517 type:complete len:212 (-) Transcript_3384:1378-2013(-)